MAFDFSDAKLRFVAGTVKFCRVFSEGLAG